ncbi:MAG: hypothetical protein ACPG47_04785, partial [Leucothrix sp.]
TYPQGLTPEYSSPQRRDHKPPHVADDVYSLGIILGQLLIGGVLPRVATELLLNKRYKQIDLEKFLELIPSRELREIVKKATHDTADERYVSAYMMGEDLNNWLHDKPVLAVASTSKWPLYALSKNLIRNRKAWLILLGFGLLFAAGSYGWNKVSVNRLHTKAAAAAKKVTSDLAAVLSRAQPSIGVQSELTGIALNNIEENLLRAPDNISARYVYAHSLMRYAQLEGHPLYLSKENPVLALQSLREANESLGIIREVMQENGITEQLGEQASDRIDLQMVDVDQLTVERLMAEIQVYYDSNAEPREQGLTQLHDVESKLLGLNYYPESRQRKLSYAEDLIYLAHTRLLDAKVEANRQLLDKAKAILTTVAANPPLSTDEKGLSQKEIRRRDQLNRPEFDVLKRLRFLKFFILEQEAYQAFVQGKTETASNIYRKIIAGTTKLNLDVRLAMLNIRTKMMQACIASDAANSADAAQLQSDLLSDLNELLEDHPGAKRLSMLSQQFDKAAVPLPQQLGCDDPRAIVFPLRKVTDNRD